MVEKLISGGQTGTDRAALDVALEINMTFGGWCPQGRRAEDGYISEIYPLNETPSSNYSQRTEWNVRDSDGTLIICRGIPTGGTFLTVTMVRRMRKPLLVIDVAGLKDSALELRHWLDSEQFHVLNVAGPRESKQPGIYAWTKSELKSALENSS